ncbi:transcriptional regulator [Pedobacter sp. KBW06]|uniref:winged helix-turn-helix transcriptional regulator n=1 Tax=Pedobacter sp. KBW06 TaxID=2153359 RepID=UPI000F5B18EA|nr:helix-turn-helix domain-containing protein [Pedobacter sp. KBW06]RQO74643.1 transcriptional regulator [Pedobacter sp. KBW06]
MDKQEGTATLPKNTSVTIAGNEGLKDSRKLQEIFQNANTTANEICPVRDVIARISDKWSILSIYALGAYGKLRFSELIQKIDGISHRMLTVTLRNLERDGFIKRTVHAEVPPRVDYELTALGHSLMQQLSGIIGWAEANAPEILAFRNKK